MNNNGTTDKALEGGKDQYGMTPDDWARLDAMTDDEVTACALADPDAQPLTAEQSVKMRRIAPARFIRMKLRMTLDGFAAAYGIPVDTLRAWERHEAEPTPAELSYLRAIQRTPDAVRVPATEPAE